MPESHMMHDCRVLYKAAPAWQEPPDVRAMLDVSSPDISEDTVLLPLSRSQDDHCPIWCAATSAKERTAAGVQAEVAGCHCRNAQCGDSYVVRGNRVQQVVEAC